MTIAYAVARKNYVDDSRSVEKERATGGTDCCAWSPLWQEARAEPRRTDGMALVARFSTREVAR
jgi:hypothetical protein